MVKKICVLFFGMLLHGISFAQQIYISGTAVNDRGLPLSGVSITFRGQSISTISAIDGRFSITVPAGKQLTLQASLPGYASTGKTVQVYRDSVQITVILFPLSRDLDEVEVKDNTALNRSRESALNTQHVTRDFLLKNLGGSLMQSLERLPGVKTIGIGSGQSKPLIRGMGFNRVLVTDKGIKHEGQQWGADHGLEVDQFAAGEVEIVKGAASFAYGSDAIGGVIDIRPERFPAAHTLSGSLDLVGKSNNALYGSSLNLMGRIEQWFFSARFTYQNYGDYTVPADSLYIYDFRVETPKGRMRNTAGRDMNTHLTTGFIGRNFRSVIYFSNIDNHSGFFANAHGLEPRRVDAAVHDASARDILNPAQEVNHFKLINRTDIQLDQHALSIDAGYQHNFRQEFSQYVNHGYMPPVYPVNSSIPGNLEREFDKQVYSLNVKDKFTSGKHTLSMGISGEHQDNDIDGWSFLVPAFNQTSYGAFAYDQFRLNEKVLLHAAVRYDFARLNMKRYDDWFSTPLQTQDGIVPVNLTRADAISRNFHSLVYAIGMNFNHSEFSLKWNLGKSFRMPIAKELGANGVNYHYFSYEQGNAELAPEVSYQADLGLTYTTKTWSVTFNPFYNYFSNYIYLNPTPDHDYAYGAGNQIFRYQQSRVQRYGAELEIKAQLFKHFSAEILAEYLRSTQLSGEKKGYTLPFSPPASALFNLTYARDLSKRLQAAYIAVDYRLTARQDNIVPPEKKTPGYQVVNLQAGARLGSGPSPVSIRIQVQNLFDTRYLNHTSFYRLISLPEQGRNFTLSLSIPFNLKSIPHQ